MDEVATKLHKKLKTLNHRSETIYDDIEKVKDAITEYQNKCKHEFSDEMGSEFDYPDDYHSWIQYYDTWDCTKCGFKKKVKRKIVSQLATLNDWSTTDCQDHKHFPFGHLYVLTGTKLEYECPTCKALTVVESPIIDLNE